MEIFTDEWAFALKDAINDHPTFKKEAEFWTHGPVGFTVRYNDESQEDISLFIDMDRGECRFTMLLSATDAFRACSFIVEANFQTWEKIFNQELTLRLAFMTGKLKLTKGSVYKTIGIDKASVSFIQAAVTLMQQET